MQHVRLKPDIHSQLFVGSMEGPPSCSLDSETYDIWPKLLVMVLLQGAQHFVIDDKSFRIDAGCERHSAPTVLMLNVARGSTLRFINDSNVPLRKVQISAPRFWLDWLVKAQTPNDTSLKRFLSRHLTAFEFAPGRQIIDLAEQLMHPPPTMQDEMRALYRHSRGVDIMCAACANLHQKRNKHSRRRIKDIRQSESVRDYIVAHLNEPLTIDHLARSVGTSSASMQRHFKQSFGVTIFDFIREKRLERACAALKRDGISIAQAAHLACYSDTAHFATAFKRIYGVSPGQWRG